MLRSKETSQVALLQKLGQLGSLKDGFVLCSGKEDNRLSNLNQAVPYTF
jgi:hypothetical protein